MFLVASCVYLHVHEKRRKASSPRSVFVLGSFAEGGAADPASRDTAARSGSSKSGWRARSKGSIERDEESQPGAEQELTSQTPRNSDLVPSQSDEGRWAKGGGDSL